MTRPRKELISLQDTSYYHCINRCVRRAFLCGVDHLTGNNYEHRKHWVVERLSLLSQMFSIEIAAYAVMSNHLHLLLRVDSEQSKQWSSEEVIDRWSRLHHLPVLIQRFQCGETASKGELIKVNEILALWRSRLMNFDGCRRTRQDSHSSGMEMNGGPPALNQQDQQAFANQLDRLLVQRKK